MSESRLLERFFRYVSCASESGNEKQFCELLESELKAVGMEIIRDEVGEKVGSNGWNIYACLPGEGEPILFSAHMDTVPNGIEIAPVVSGGIVRSAGETILAADDKSGIAPVVEALQIIKEENRTHRPVEVLFSVCEEVGLLGSKYADYSNVKSKQAIVLDNGRHGSVVNNSPAKLELHVKVTGRSAHAAVQPSKGVNAIKAAAAAIAKIPSGEVDDQTVMNVANFLSPGKSNVVPDKASFDLDMRSFDNDRLETHVENVKAALREACEEIGASFEVEIDRQAEILFVPPESELIARLGEVYGALGIEHKIERTYGGSDATWIFQNGIDVVNIGTGMADVHSSEEHISVADLETTLKIVLAMTE
ncbi:MAG: M20/M25/M40 family metallo-hydrolase [Oscillospiraceae bacterium]|nr:M20/M25/M40 family metallo-hydrolase [Oscillospiraceae bacterium]